MTKGKNGRGMFAVTVTMVLFFVWALWVSVNHQSHHHRHYRHGNEGDFIEREEVVGRMMENNDKKAKPKKPGIVFDLNKNTQHFQIDGFRYYRKSPLKDKKLKADSVWMLSNREGEEKKASIKIANLQRLYTRSRRKKNRHLLLKDVVLVVKYHLHWQGIVVTVTGTDVNVKEEIVETLPIHDDEHYCTSILYLGQVNQVLLEAIGQGKKSHFVIDELKVVVGSELYDDVEEVTCH